MKVSWTQQARSDLARVDEYHNAEAPHYGRFLAATAIEAASFLADFPRAGAPYASNTRKWRIKRTPYILIYRANPNEILILRVRHSAEDWWTGL